MADDNNKKTADEIVDDLAAEMGVENESADTGDDVVNDLGGIFGVSGPKKKKKKKVVEEPEAPAEEPAAAAPEASEPAEEVEEVEASEKETVKVPKTEKKAKKKNTAGIDGIFVGGGDAPAADDSYLSAEDLGDYDAPKNKTTSLLIGIIVLLVVGLGVAVVFATGSGGDLVALLQGNLKEKRIAEAKAAEEAFRQEQLAKLDHFGNLLISGNPQYAVIKLDGQLQYGETSQGWRELRVGPSTAFQNLKVNEKHTVEVSSPGFEPKTFTITEGMWEEHPGSGDSGYMLSANLSPQSVEHKQEFDARLSQDVENEFFGELTINSMPAGAAITINNKPVLDEKGEAIVTPATLEKYWVKDEESGKLEEIQVRVDTPLDIGHKIELEMAYPNSCAEEAEAAAAPAAEAAEAKEGEAKEGEAKEGAQPLIAQNCKAGDGCCPSNCNVATDSDCKWPKYITSLQRQMWTCDFKEGFDPAKLGDDSIQKFCDYSTTVEVDFNGLKNYILEREAERKRIAAQFKEVEEEMAARAEEAE